MANAQDWVATNGQKALEGAFDDAGQSFDFPLTGWVNVTLWTDDGAIFEAQLEKGFGGPPWHPIKDFGMQFYHWTEPSAALFADGETGVRVRLNVLSVSGGTLKWRISR